MKIILASSSPRRQEILRNINMQFDVFPSNIEEKIEQCENLEENAINISKQKAMDVLNRTKGERIIIGADTIVKFNNIILGKPQDKLEAKKMLEILNGNKCVVYTGIYVAAEIKNLQKEYSNLSNCQIKISKMTQNEIEEYIQTGEPMDKAGGFAIQGIGAKYIEDIHGDFYSGIGLSICELYKIFKQIKEEFDIEIEI